MTPTLLGRWQIRIFLLATVGLVISLIVSLIVKSTLPLYALLYVLLFGLVWDGIYQCITSFRWDRDWPTSFQVAAGIIEGALVWGLILTKKLPGIAVPPPFIVFLIQYGLIWLSIFVLVQGPLRVIWLKWRYQGGQWFVSRSARPEDLIYQPQSTSAPQVVGRYNSQQPLPATQSTGGYNLEAGAIHLTPTPPVAGGNYPQHPPAAQVVGGTMPQQVVTPPLVAHATQPDHHQSPGELAGKPLAHSYTCVCGLTFDRGNFCPRCGRPKAQQGVP